MRRRSICRRRIKSTVVIVIVTQGYPYPKCRSGRWCDLTSADLYAGISLDTDNNVDIVS